MPFMLPRFVHSGLLPRALCGTVAVASIAHSAPCMARQASGPDDEFARRSASRNAETATSAGHLHGKHKHGERDGPFDVAALPAAPATVQAASWRFCTDCAYDDGLPKPFRPLAIRANFQPIGGTVRYRF